MKHFKKAMRVHHSCWGNLSLVNAHFALIMGMAYLNYKIHGELCEELLYSISYRDVNKESLMILASALRLILERGVDAVVLKSPNKDKMPED